MPQFSYRARRRNGELVEGVLDVADRPAAVAQVERLGLFPIAVDASKGASNRGAIMISIVRAEGEPPRALVAVEDNGIGISAQDQKRIFSGFYRTEESRKVAKGFGIGLMLVNELLERHGSRLEITSEPRKGSRFAFHLPVWEQSSPGGGEK